MQQIGEHYLVALLYDRKCPFDYQCKAVDCVECAKIHMEKGGAVDGNA